MVFASSASSKRHHRILVALEDYPILCDRIRAYMRRELFERGIIQAQAFESIVRKMAVDSQQKEGLKNPFSEEPGEVWELRLKRIRDHFTDITFSKHLTFEIFENIVKQTLNERGITSNVDLNLSINLELAPMEMVFDYARTIEGLPIPERTQYESRLQEAKVILIRTMISDHLRYQQIAREWFTIADLSEIRMHKIGAGRIGGKAAGMLLASRILKTKLEQNDEFSIITPESYYVGSGELYSFMSINQMTDYNNQKYKDPEVMRAEYPKIVCEFERGHFPLDLVEKLQILLDSVGKKPLIVRSSSLLEDNFGTSFAGKYLSIFLPNQDTPEQNLKELTRAMAHIYASTLNPTALLYRHSKKLIEYDERMALLIQAVQGEQFGRYYLPHAAGVAFSRNMYRWHPQIRREDGFVRLVWGLGTRAVDRVGSDYPRLVALSHPLLHPSTDPKSIRRYSQQLVDLLDLQENKFKTLPVREVLEGRYPPLRYLAQVEEDGYLSNVRSTIVHDDVNRVVLTFDELLRRTSFAENMRLILRTLEQSYQSPVDLEFTLHLEQTNNKLTHLYLTLLQCRPQSHLQPSQQVTLPKDLAPEKIVFSTNFMAPQGFIPRVDYVLFVPPERYFALPATNYRFELRRAIGQLNAVLGDVSFICIGPGRWGSANSDLGVPVDYGDIYHSRALVELAGKGIGPAPEPSLGTHFFQDLVEAQIYPLAIYLDDIQSIFRREFFYDTPNRLLEYIQVNERQQECLRFIRVADYRPAHFLRVVMDEEKNQVVAFLTTED